MTVASRHAHNAHHTCGSKPRYSSFQGAESRARELKSQRGYPFEVYHCAHCGGFDVGNPPTKHGNKTSKQRRAFKELAERILKEV